MKEFAYYPGCSLESTGKPYDVSVRAVFAKLGLGLKEIEDWNCCGATMYMSVDKLIGYAVSARNLAIAENYKLDICAPCSSCYTILRKTNRHMGWNIHSRRLINEALSAAGLSYNGNVEVRHPLDIIVNDVGVENVAAAADFNLNDLRIAPYYGCQIVRPVFHFDDLEDPQTMDKLFDALGAKVVHYPDKVRCCGGMLMTTFETVAIDLNDHLLTTAAENGAQVIATACPLCQMNLEAYQRTINARKGKNHKMPIVYFSQILGLALGIAAERLAFKDLLVQFEDYKLKPMESQPATRIAV
ncbi:MAG: disulfide reductase [Calditrichaeota bacterium]|nr:disulfide reductase [Calditrichota bacterium]